MSVADSAPVALLLNLGEQSARMLCSVGIRTIGELRTVGPVEVYRRLEVLGGRPSLTLLWAMVAGLRGEHWNRLSPEEKLFLQRQLATERPPGSHTLPLPGLYSNERTRKQARWRERSLPPCVYPGHTAVPEESTVVLHLSVT